MKVLKGPMNVSVSTQIVEDYLPTFHRETKQNKTKATKEQMEKQ